MNAELTKAKATRCLLMNLFLLPGAGSLKGGRRMAGTWQLLLLVIGTLMIVPMLLEAINQFLSLYKGIADMAETGTGDVPQSLEGLQETLLSVWSKHAGLTLGGIALTMASWIWGFFTGFSLMTEAAQREVKNQK